MWKRLQNDTKARVDLENTYFALGLRAAERSTPSLANECKVCNLWEPIFVTVEFVHSADEFFLVTTFKVLEVVVI